MAFYHLCGLQSALGLKFVCLNFCKGKNKILNFFLFKTGEKVDHFLYKEFINTKVSYNESGVKMIT